MSKVAERVRNDGLPVRLLALTFYYPPANNPRAIQVSRLLRRVSIPTTIICAEFHDANDRHDKGTIFDSQHHRLAVPFVHSSLARLATRTAGRVIQPFWDELPDDSASWKPAVLSAIAEHLPRMSEKQIVLATFGSPMNDHVIGLELKRKYGFPWIAFFSDPWTDNPFKRFSWFSRKANLNFEREVMQTADRLLFTSEETIDLVLGKYPAGLKTKAGVLPHSYEPEQYPTSPPSEKITVRYLGDMYGPRTPRPLFAALAAIHSTDPKFLENVVFEFVGSMCDLDLASMGLNDLPEGLIKLVPTVSNLESLKLMTSADVLLVIDAPAERSVFLPSKLVDYLGAAKPILGITPPGTSEKLIKDLGGETADPSDFAAVAHATKTIIDKVTYRRMAHTFNSPFGRRSTLERFTTESVAGEFERLVRELI